MAPTRERLAVKPPTRSFAHDQDYNVDAPGANDNGSGTALTMELARVLATSGVEFDATIVFALWAGEEQGLVGSRIRAATRENKTVVDANINNDIVGNSHGVETVMWTESVRVSEGPEDSPSRALARYIVSASPLYVPSHRIRLMARPDRFSSRQRSLLVQRLRGSPPSPSANRYGRTSPNSIPRSIPSMASTSRILRRTPG